MESKETTTEHYELEFGYCSKEGSNEIAYYRDVNIKPFPEKEKLQAYLEEKFPMVNIVELGKMSKVNTSIVVTEIEY
jgi:hypothetical protein